MRGVEARTENDRPIRCAVRKTLILSFSRREKGSALATVVRSKVTKSLREKGDEGRMRVLGGEDARQNNL